MCIRDRNDGAEHFPQRCGTPGGEAAVELLALGGQSGLGVEGRARTVHVWLLSSLTCSCRSGGVPCARWRAGRGYVASPRPDEAPAEALITGAAASRSARTVTVMVPI